MAEPTSYSKLENLPLEQLLSLREKHPFFSALNAVASKKLKTSPYFSNERALASLQAADRNALRKFLELETKAIELEQPIEEVVETIASIGVPEMVQNERAETAVFEKREPTEQKAEEVVIEVSHPVEKPIDRMQSHSFYDWILLYNQKGASPIVENIEEATVVDDLDQLMLSSAQSASYFSETIAHEKSYSKGLDSFLESQKTKKRMPVATSDNDLVTETLAKLYLAQGMNDKAVDVYKKLMLKNPEKSSYFALQIQKLKK